MFQGCSLIPDMAGFPTTPGALCGHPLCSLPRCSHIWRTLRPWASQSHFPLPLAGYGGTPTGLEGPFARFCWAHLFI